MLGHWIERCTHSKSREGASERQAIPFTALSARGSVLFGGNSISSRQTSRLPFLAFAGYSCGLHAASMQLRRRFLSQDDRQYRDAFIARKTMSFELVSLLR